MKEYIYVIVYTDGASRAGVGKAELSYDLAHELAYSDKKPKTIHIYDGAIWHDYGYRLTLVEL